MIEESRREREERRDVTDAVRESRDWDCEGGILLFGSKLSVCCAGVA